MTKKQKNLLLRVIIAGVCMIVLALLPLKQYPVLRFLLFLIPYLTVGYDILLKAFKGIRNKQVFDEHFLMAVATIGAMALGEYTEGVAVMWFYQIGELFQSYAVGKSRKISPSSWISGRITRTSKMRTARPSGSTRTTWRSAASLLSSRARKFRLTAS
jgi:cation transport ATPase